MRRPPPSGVGAAERRPRGRPESTCLRLPVRGDRGLSLIETLVAVTLLGIGMSGAFGLLAAAERALAEATNRTEAGGLAEAELERLLRLPWSDLSAENSVTVRGRFTLAASATPIDAGLAALRVTVSWDAPSGRNTARLATLRARGVAP